LIVGTTDSYTDKRLAYYRALRKRSDPQLRRHSPGKVRHPAKYGLQILTT